MFYAIFEKGSKYFKNIQDFHICSKVKTELFSTIDCSQPHSYFLLFVPGVLKQTSSSRNLTVVIHKQAECVNISFEVLLAQS